MSRALLTILLCLCLQAQARAASPPGCQALAPPLLRVRIGNQTPRFARLESLPAGGLRLRDPSTREELWSAGPQEGAMQPVPEMRASFGSSLAAVDLDADQLHDRIYAGDRLGRLWRLDLHHGAPADSWMQASLIADLGSDGRGFVAAPDITLLRTADGNAWINIAIGSASLGAAAADNRLYVVHDSLAATTRATPLRESDLLPVTTASTLQDPSAPGFFLSLGRAEVLAQALTLQGRIHLTVAANLQMPPGACPAGTLPARLAEIRVIVVDASNGQSQTPPRELGALAASVAVELSAAPALPDGKLPCRAGSVPLPDCFLDTQPQRRWWLRKDAD